MSRLLYRLGHGSAAHPWRTIVAWVGIAVIVVGLGSVFGGEPQDDYDVPDARAQVGVDQLREHLPASGFASAQVVVHDRDGGAPTAGQLDSLEERLARHAPRPGRQRAPVVRTTVTPSCSTWPTTCRSPTRT